MTTLTHSMRERALKLIAEGRVSVSEMARLTDISQQVMHVYARRAGIDPLAARRQYLEGLWRYRSGKRRPG
jgi:transposase-like protein